MRRIASGLTGLICFCTLAAAPAWSQLPGLGTGADKPTLAPLLREVTPAVVSIAVTALSEPVTSGRSGLPFEGPIPEELRPFLEGFGGQSAPREGVGSGVIIDAENGYILTNNHVIESAEDIRVRLHDGRETIAEVIGGDPGTDIALIRIDAPNLQAIQMGDSRTLEVGDFVLAIGNPYGIGQTVTSGIVSALGRSTGRGSEETYEDFIQTDAAINPGNSGGALIDLDGRLVGINSAIVSTSSRSGNVGIGFAVPTTMATLIVDQLLEFGDVRRGLLGVRIQTVTPDIAAGLGVEAGYGAIVTEVVAESAAETAGLEEGDVITGLNGEPVESSAQLRNRIGLMRPGTRISLNVVRGTRTRDFIATIGGDTSEELVSFAEPQRASADTVARLEGATLGPIASDDPRRPISGVMVLDVERPSQAYRAGLVRGDIIIEINRMPTPTVNDLREIMEDIGSGAAAVRINRQGSTLYMGLP